MVKIIKKFQGQAPENKILNYISESETDGYSCAIINGMSIPIDAIIDYDGDEVPEGYEQVPDENYYSAEERRIGTWFGKPLYRRVFDIGALPNASQKLFATDILSGTIHVVSLTGLARRLTGVVAYIPLPFTNYTTIAQSIILSAWEEAGVLKLNVQAGTNRSDYNGLIVLEYTKTKD